MSQHTDQIAWFETLRRTDVGRVGGKNASLGEMVQALAAHGIRVPPGFATTAGAYWEFVEANDLRSRIAGHLAAWEEQRASLPETGEAIRNLILKASWPETTAEAIRSAYRELCRRGGGGDGKAAGKRHHSQDLAELHKNLPFAATSGTCYAAPHMAAKRCLTGPHLLRPSNDRSMTPLASEWTHRWMERRGHAD